MPADLPTVWVANPELVTSAIQLLSAAVIALGGIIIAGGRWIATYMMKQMNDRTTSLESNFATAVKSLEFKFDRLATGVESLALTTSNQITKIEVRCQERHGNHHRQGDPDS
jgi:hypothetical protein